MVTTNSKDNITIRRYTEADLETRLQAIRESSSEISRWLAWCRPDYSSLENDAWFEKCERGWEEGDQYYFAIIDSRKNQLVGECQLNHINRLHKLANIVYWVRSGCSGQGIATAATLLIARFAFEELELRRLEIFCSLRNLASQKVAKKGGAKKEGILRNRIYHHSVSEDAIMYSLIPSDLDNGTMLEGGYAGMTRN